MRMKLALCAAMLLIGGPLMAAAQTGTGYDLDQLPALQGTVRQYSLTPRGDVDGLILSDGTEIHVPPHLGTQLVYAVKPGDTVTVHGLRARAVPMVEALSVRNDATGATVEGGGPGGPRGPRSPGEALTDNGRIQSQLHGPQGDLNGVLMQDGTIVRLPPPEAQRLAADLAPGKPLYVQGDGYAGPLGRVIAANALGPDANQLVQVEAGPPGPPPLGGPFGSRPPR